MNTRKLFKKYIESVFNHILPEYGKIRCKKPVFTVVLCSGSLSPFYLWHNKETKILYLHFICKFIEPFLSKPFFLLWNSMFYSLLPELLYDFLFLETIQKSGSFDFNFLTYSIVSECLWTNISHISRGHVAESQRCYNVKSSAYYFYVKTKYF